METLNDILEESARKFGGKDALMIRPGFRTRAWSYRDLNDVTQAPRHGCLQDRLQQRRRLLIRQMAIVAEHAGDKLGMTAAGLFHGDDGIVEIMQAQVGFSQA